MKTAEMSLVGPTRRWRSPELAAGYWGGPAATVASGPQGQSMPRTAAVAITLGPRQRAPGSGGRTVGLRTGPVGRAGVVGASEMATSVRAGVGRDPGAPRRRRRLARQLRA
jgi:hypothetical protein